MRKPTSVAESESIRVVIVTLDGHLSGAVARARRSLAKDLPGLSLSMHVAAEWADDPAALEACRAEIEQGDLIIAHMLFMENHIEPVLPWLERRRMECDAMIGCMSASPVAQLTRMGRFEMSGDETSVFSRLRGLRKSKKEGGTPGARQAAMLRRVPQILRFIPGTAQDVRAYLLTMQYWLAGSDRNVEQMIRFLVNRYADGPRRGLRGRVKADLPIEYPDVGVYHPRLPGGLAGTSDRLPGARHKARGTVGLLVMRSYVLGGNTAHYDGVIDALEARGLRVIPAFASGLDSRPAIERFFMDEGSPIVDAVVSLTGFSLVGGPAYNDAGAAEEMLARLDVPYVAAHAVEFQTLEQWEASDAGLLPLEATMMVAIPELDGATAPMVFGGRSSEASADRTRDMKAHPERVEALAARVDRLVSLRETPRAERKVGIVLFNFPPNAGNTGTAMYLSVFESLYRTLLALRREGYSVEVPDSVEDLRERVVRGNAEQLGAHAHVHKRIPVDEHVRDERWLAEIEAQWGPAPGRQQSDGGSIFVLGVQLGNVFVGVQPAFGYEGDPMRLLFEKGFAPTHAFSAFYRFLREDFGADALLHFGTHGALEFMPGKQVGLAASCWPDRLLGDLPNLYLYAANNPSEGVIAKRRSGATLISHLTPPIAHAGLYRGLTELDASIERWRAATPAEGGEREELADLIQAQAAELDLVPAEPAWKSEAADRIRELTEAVRELEQTLIPCGLHVVGEAPSVEERVDLLMAVADAAHSTQPDRRVIEALVEGASPSAALSAGEGERNDQMLACLRALEPTARLLAEDHELPALIRALDGRFIRPTPGGDVLRTPDVLPTGRNLHGFDPFRMPSAFAVRDGQRQAERLIERHERDGHPLPESIAIVLWGTDNLKTEGASIAQALALIGARPRFDSYGRLAGAALIPLEELGRPRIDVVTTLSGIFRDLFPFQTRLLAEASYLAASAEEPLERNFVRKRSLELQAKHGCDLETASLRVFSNSLGTYGANVGNLVQNDLWNEEDDLAEAYTRRKSFAYGRTGEPVQRADLLQSVLAGVDLAYQNLDSVDIGVTTVDVYFDNLGGISRAIQRASGDGVPVYIGDHTRGDSTVRTLGEQVSLETRTRMLNPKWYEGMLRHGYEGVRQIESHVTNTMGWSATTGQVAPWVYRQLATTYVLDAEMRERMAELNPTASVRVAHRLLEAHERAYWSPDPDMLEALRDAGMELEDRVEGIQPGVAA